MGFFDLFSAEVHESYLDKIKRQQREMEERIKNGNKYSDSQNRYSYPMSQSTPTTTQQERRNRMAEGVANYLSELNKTRKPKRPDFSEKPLWETIGDGFMSIGSGLVVALEFTNDVALEVIDYLESRK